MGSKAVGWSVVLGGDDDEDGSWEGDELEDDDDF